MRRIILLFFLFTPALVSAQQLFRAMQLNTENFFDFYHDSLHADYDFLPEGANHWTQQRFWHKLRSVSKTIAAVGDGHIPDLVSLCEVENDSVMNYLTKRSPLRIERYGFVITHGSDKRGINVALLYQPATFKFLKSTEIVVPLSSHWEESTRNILHVTGVLPTLDTLDVYVCHMPSRLGGSQDTEPFRISATRVLRMSVDSVLSGRCVPMILIMGDFNENPDDVSIKKILRAQPIPNSIPYPQLCNMTAGVRADFNGCKGTYCFHGVWSTIDQIIVNDMLLDKAHSFYTTPSACHIADFSFLLQPDKVYGAQKPFRTYLGPRYLGGYSDHLPVYIDFNMRF
jgi:endonuclease/exonuclease/phosphatase family metal-dependent hydrolase